MGNDKLIEHAQKLQGCEKCNPRKPVGNLELPYGCEITVIARVLCKAVLTVAHMTLPISGFKKVQLLSSNSDLTEFYFGLPC